VKLFWSSRSPLVRKVMMAAHEVGIADRIRTERVVVAAWYGWFARRPSMQATEYVDAY